MYTNREKWAYISGFVDGEGTIGIKRYITKYNSDGKLSAYISIANTHREVLEWIKGFFDSIGIESSIYSYKITKKLSEPLLDANKVYYIHIGGFNQLLLVLDNIMPFLVIKQKAARILRDYIILRAGKVSKNRNAPYSNKERQLYNSIKQRGFTFKIA